MQVLYKLFKSFCERPSIKVDTLAGIGFFFFGVAGMVAAFTTCFTKTTWVVEHLFVF